MYIKNFGKPEEQWKSSIILAGIVNQFLNQNQVYEASIGYLMVALARGQDSEYYDFIKKLPDVDALYKKFNKELASFRKTGQAPDSIDNMSDKRAHRHELNAPQFAAVLFYQTDWVNKPPEEAVPQLNKIYNTIGLMLIKRDFLK